MGFRSERDALNQPESLYALGGKNHGVRPDFAGQIKDETGRENVVDIDHQGTAKSGAGLVKLVFVQVCPRVLARGAVLVSEQRKMRWVSVRCVANRASLVAVAGWAGRLVDTSLNSFRSNARMEFSEPVGCQPYRFFI